MSPASMSGKICIVTGANSGIGKETALGLAQMGARVVMVCRNAEKGKAALEEIRRECGSSQVDLLIADMSSQASVRVLAEQIRQKYPCLDVLVNNAGGAAWARTPRHARSPVRAAEIQCRRRLPAVETADERVYVRAGAEAGGNGSHRELPASRRGSHEYLERRFCAAHRQADRPPHEAVHADFKTGRRGVPVSRDLSGGRASLRRILRQVQASQIQASFAGSEVDGGSLAV